MDRNYSANAVDQILPVALRKESVDRNVSNLNMSCSAVVALRKESVDRNCVAFCLGAKADSRSPQGERG